MLIFIFGILGIVLGIGFIHIHDNCNISYDFKDGFMLFTVLFIGISTIVTGAFIGMAIGNSITYETNYENALHEREVIEYRLNHMEENLTGNEMLYNDIVEFNNKLRSQKKWANNLWTNWYYNQDIAALDYIELGD